MIAEGAELVAPVHDGDLRSEASKEQRLLHSRVTSSHDHEFLIPKEESVTGCTSGHTVSGEALLTRNREPFGGCPGRDDESPGLVDDKLQQIKMMGQAVLLGHRVEPR